MKSDAAAFFALATVLSASLASGQTGPTVLEAEAKQIETLLIAPCCWRQPISDHESEIATEMKAEIRKMLDEGMTRQAILDRYIERYGARILSIPPQQGFNRMSFVMPVVFLVLGLVVVGIVLRRWRVGPAFAAAGAPGAAGAALGQIGDDMSRRIEKELDEME